MVKRTDRVETEQNLWCLCAELVVVEEFHNGWEIDIVVEASRRSGGLQGLS